jgi:adenine-specific DNA-methyltransferase
MARAFGVSVIRAWWSEVAGADRLRPFLTDFDTQTLPQEIEDLAAELGRVVSRAGCVEAAAYQIGLIYTGMLPLAHRSAHGIFYTPPALTARLLQLAEDAGVNWSTARALDPACGGGAFLTPMAELICENLAHCDPRIIVENIGNRLRGYDLDPFGAWLSQVTLDAAMLPTTRAAGTNLPQVIEVGDSLARLAPDDGFDLVIGNPPYGRVKLGADDRARFKRSLYGHSNLYGLFTDMALQHARPGGIVAFVTPTSFLAGQYYKNLRQLLADEAPPVAIDFITARKGVFDEVLQETLLATYRRGGKPVRISVAQLDTGDDGDVIVSKATKIALPRLPSEPWLLPRSADEAALVRRVGKMATRLADWGYRVSTGPLVWNRHKSQVVAKAGDDTYPLVWAESITADGRFAFKATKRNHAPFFRFQAGDEWLVTDKPCVLLQRTTAKEQPRRLIAAVLPEDFIAKHGLVVVENHLNMVRPVGQPSVDPETVAVFLNSLAADRVFRCISGSVAVSAFELEAMPLPSVATMKELSELVHAGSSKGEIADACARLYA